ncbi:MAG: CDP-alcohol phosphatidyltransferase family protein [Spirochaetes bacterium]|nr:CDP-alcohol phosphatidyltransferase family protein [Spirochaetota bacterium]
MKLNLAWIPNSLTLGNMLLGFISLVFSSMGSISNSQPFFFAGILILGAALFDGLDGPTARALKVTSRLGGELDSLADCVAFGVAPGFLAYKAFFSGMNVAFVGYEFDVGVAIAAIFPLCAAYRLARFNVSHEPDSFSGLPSPAAGIIVALVPVFFPVMAFRFGWKKIALIIAFIVTAFLMVSTIRFSKPQTTIAKYFSGIRIVLLILFFIAVIVVFRKWSIFIFIGIYIVSGFVSFIIQFIQDRRY